MLPKTKFAPLADCLHEVNSGITHPRGFVAAGVASGVKTRHKLDLGLLASSTAGVSAVMSTSNAVAAAPVTVTREMCDCSRLRAVVVNSGIANACTGVQGLADALRMRRVAAGHLGLPEEQVAVASTGLIGVPLPMEQIEPGIAVAAQALSARAPMRFATAIRTTDRHAKSGAFDVRLEEGVVRVGLAAKGCGMISPKMATMLCFVTCDAIVTAGAWDELLRGAVAASFNRITVDGQQSTNDMVVGLCSGASGVKPGPAGVAKLGEALRAALKALAVAIVADGEGSTCIVQLTVSGARDVATAESVARSIANSPLVKTAFYGRDPNWGRIMQAAGQVLGGDDAVASSVTIAYEEVVIVRHGEPTVFDEAQRCRLRDVMHQSEIALHVALGKPGGAAATVYFSDLTHDYVTLNAEYST